MFLIFVFTLNLSALEKGKQSIAKIPKVLSTKTSGINPEYLIYIPEDYSSSKPKPLMIFLHGSGERGSDINSVKKHGPPKVAGKLIKEFIVVSPQCMKDENGKGWWNTKQLEIFAQHIIKTYNVDEKRMYLTGLSMGGFATWAFAAYKPNLFAAVAPVCGGGKPTQAKNYGKLPIWAFHGDKDHIVPIKKSQEMVDAIKALNGNIKFTIYPGVKHNSWDNAYADPKLYKWFLSHKKN